MRATLIVVGILMSADAVLAGGEHLRHFREETTTERYWTEPARVVVVDRREESCGVPPPGAYYDTKCRLYWHNNGRQDRSTIVWVDEQVSRPRAFVEERTRIRSCRD